MDENRANVIRDVLGLIGTVANNRQVPAPAPAPEPKKEKPDYTPFIIAGVFTIVSALIIRGK